MVKKTNRKKNQKPKNSTTLENPIGVLTSNIATRQSVYFIRRILDINIHILINKVITIMVIRPLDDGT